MRFLCGICAAIDERAVRCMMVRSGACGPCARRILGRRTRPCTGHGCWVNRLGNDGKYEVKKGDFYPFTTDKVET